MDTIVMKFGGSSVANNDRLKLVAQKIIDMYNKENNIVVILSAQGKTTDKLINEASTIIEEIKILGLKTRPLIPKFLEKWICYLVLENKFQSQS